MVVARAKVYDDREDAGLSFSVDELEAYDPEQWAQERVAKLCAMRQVVMRRIELPDVPKLLWHKEMAKNLRDKIGWYCKAVPLVAATPEELGDVGLPGRNTVRGKELSKAAAFLEEEVFLGQWATEAEDALRYVVTIGRRAGAHCKWSSAKHKQSNRLANCVRQELFVIEKLERSLASYT